MVARPTDDGYGPTASNCLNAQQTFEVGRHVEAVAVDAFHLFCALSCDVESLASAVVLACLPSDVAFLFERGYHLGGI